MLYFAYGSNMDWQQMKNPYRREERHVFVHGDNKQPLAAAVYFGEPQKAPPLPNQDYKNLILSGARRWGLPEVYIRQLEAIEVDR